MEMIAMLGGLGAGPYLENPSPAARAAGNAISMAKSVEEVMAVKTAIPQMGLTPAEASTLDLIAVKKIENLTTPFYQKPGYWFLVAGLAAAWYHREKIKSLFDRGSLRGLSGGYKIIGNEMSGYRMEFADDGKLDYDAAFRECARINDVSRNNRAFRSSSAAKGACVFCGGSDPCTRSD